MKTDALVFEMFDSLSEIEKIVKSEDFKFIKKKILLFDANLRMMRTSSDLIELRNDMDTFFDHLKKNPQLSIIFSFNKYLLYKELEERLKRYEI